MARIHLDGGFDQETLEYCKAMTGAESTFELPDKEQYFRQLKQCPGLSWPALGLFLFGLGIMAGSTGMALSGDIPLWSASLISGFGLYLLFSIVHDSIHRSLSTNALVNEMLGRISLLLLIPAAPMEVARWAHFQHHRFTSGPQDPDNYIHRAKWWNFLLRWPNFDVHYFISFLREGGEYKKRHGRSLAISSGAFLSFVGAVIYLGYGVELLFLWFLPSRIALILIAIVFVKIPHYPATVTAEENEYEATTIRLGWEWLLTPLFVYHNYHLIHHLYPTAPFYNYIKIWHLKYDELIAQKPVIQKGLALTPSNR